VTSFEPKPARAGRFVQREASTLPGTVLTSWLESSVRTAAAEAPRLSWRRGPDLVLLAAALAAGLAVRLHLLHATDFPINDGALFVAFIEAIVPVFPRLPDTVAFSGLSIPFAYPPLSFWLAAGAVRLGAQPVLLVHQLPIVMNAAYLLLFAALLLRTGHSRLFTAVASFVFGTTFLSYEWLVMGGGLSRGLGSVLLLLTLLVLLPAPAGQEAAWRWRRPLAGGLCVGLALLAHLEWGLLAAFSAVACCTMARQGLGGTVRALVLVAAPAAAVVAPWFWSVVEVHGLEPFIAAARTGSLQRLDAAPGGIGKVAWSFNLLLPFLAIGGLAVLRSRDAFWLAFLVAALVLTPRGGRTPAMLALAVLSATGLLTVAGLARRWPAPGRQPGLAAGAAVVLAAVLAVRTVPALQPDRRFVVLPAEIRDAMAWVGTRHPGSHFAVLNDLPWYYNASAEWFPVLAQAVNTTTVQGREWLPDHDFRRAELAVQALNTSTSCEQVLRSLQAFARADFIWAEAVDLQARTASPPSDSTPAGSAATSRGGLHGPGTVAGCFEGGAYEEVHANARVRIFRVPRALDADARAAQAAARR
jgi:hypothetical protein